MKKTKIFLDYFPEFNAYGVSDETIDSLTAAGITPIISLKKEDMISLGAEPKSEKPLIGFLMCREKGHYTIDYNYAKALVQAGVNIRFLTYHSPAQQISNVDGICLPGGAFDSPDFFYNDGKQLYQPNIRYEAYEKVILTAEEKGLPILAICGGAQIVAGLHKMNLYRDVHQYTGLIHKTKEIKAHLVRIYPDTVLRKLLGREQIITNSRHREAVNPNIMSDLQIYAEASDGIPEAWGNEEKNILCIEWHPEDFAAKGNARMQNIYNWLADKAIAFRQNR